MLKTVDHTPEGSGIVDQILQIITLIILLEIVKTIKK